MFCKNCGKELAEGAAFCPECGASVGAAEENATPATPVVESAPITPTISQSAQTKVLVFGIIGLALSCSFWMSIVGIIFSAIAKGQYKKLAKTGLPLGSKVKVGKGLATAGIIVGIILSIICAIYLIVIIIAAIAGGIAGTFDPSFYI